MRSFQVCSARASFWETVMRSRKACSSLTPRSVASARLRISVSREREWNISVEIILPATTETSFNEKTEQFKQIRPLVLPIPHLFDRSQTFQIRQLFKNTYGTTAKVGGASPHTSMSPKTWQAIIYSKFCFFSGLFFFLVWAPHTDFA